jgi:signal transduction histidine kinase
MSKTGLTLQLEKKLSVVSDVNLLIVTDSHVCLQEIERVLQAMTTVNLNCHNIACDCSSQVILQQKYDLIIYNYTPHRNTSYALKSSADSDSLHPISELAWWYNLTPKIPLILITEPLGDEIAISCMQSGIDAYVLRHKLAYLPQIIEKTLASFIEQKNQNFSQLLKQVTKLKQELTKLKNKQAELTSGATNITQEYFSHLNHELRSPLANILQFARMLKDEIYGSLNHKQTEYISGILTSGNHLLELINDYLDLAKIDANYEKLYPEKVSVEDICEASLVMVRGKAKEKELDLILELADDVDFCYVDSLRLKQILINLLSNAVKFTEQGSVTLQVKATSKMLQFSIIDTGIGISKKDSAKLFKPFQQINSSLNRQHKGTGLGLALSRKLAQLHGGDITLTSKAGKGSCFTVSIPRSLK